MKRMHRHDKRILVCCLAIIMIALPTTISSAANKDTLYATPLDRFGFGVAPQYGAITDYDVRGLYAGWYNNWTYTLDPPRPAGIEYVQTLRVSEGSYPPDWNQIEQVIRNNPGSIWIIGNEPDTRGQDYRLPAEYAQIYHDCYLFIKAIDPTAQVSGPAIVQPTPLRLQWLDMVLQAYYQAYGQKMPVDVWNIHMQILREDRNDWGCGIPPGIDVDQGQMYTVYDNVSMDIFRQHILAFRSWMRAKGERDKPLIISEYGVLMPSSYLGGGDATYGDKLVRDFMRDTFDYLLSATDPNLGYPADGNRLVQRWCWYSLNDKLIDLETFEGYNGPLFDWRDSTFPGTMTQFGQVYADYTSALMPRFHLPRLDGPNVYVPQ